MMTILWEDPRRWRRRKSQTISVTGEKASHVLADPRSVTRWTVITLVPFLELELDSLGYSGSRFLKRVFIVLQWVVSLVSS